EFGAEIEPLSQLVSLELSNLLGVNLSLGRLEQAREDCRHLLDTDCEKMPSGFYAGRREARLRQDERALFDPHHHHAMPLEVREFIAVQVQHHLRIAGEKERFLYANRSLLASQRRAPTSWRMDEALVSGGARRQPRAR